MRLRRPRYDVPEPVARQLRRRRWTRRGIFSVVVVLALTTFLDRWGVFRYRGDDWGNYDKRDVVVTHVIDGDTVRVRRSPQADEDAVRLLGIDAPEAGSHWADQATAHLKQLTANQATTVRLDTTQTRDKYGRLLAYLHLADAENVNLALVRDGHAYAHRMFPHALRRQFEQAEDEARGKGRGLWGTVREEQMPAWRRHWLAELRAKRKRELDPRY
jgi:endonuclease YncB( thermonuclease family)